jgi:TatD DNase family protein
LAGERNHELKTFDRYLGETRFIGEIGLDGSPEFKSTWANQTEVFEHILHACSESGNKVLSIHSRRAATPVLNTLDGFESVRFPILHWFSGSRAELERAINRGCWFSVGPAMLAGAKGRALVAAMPRNRVLLETDGPFAQLRRAPLQPWDIALACVSMSRLWGIEPAETNQVIRDNENSLLGGDQQAGD